MGKPVFRVGPHSALPRKPLETREAEYCPWLVDISSTETQRTLGHLGKTAWHRRRAKITRVIHEEITCRQMPVGF